MASVVVVGGGLAGLVCAWRLGRAGHDVEVLERESEPGGSARSEERLGFRLDRRPSLVLRADRNLRTLLAALGLEGSLAPVAQPAIGILREGRVHACDASSVLRLLLSAPVGASGLLLGMRLGLATLLFVFVLPLGNAQQTITPNYRDADIRQIIEAVGAAAVAGVALSSEHPRIGRRSGLVFHQALPIAGLLYAGMAGIYEGLADRASKYVA